MGSNPPSRLAAVIQHALRVKFPRTQCDATMMSVHKVLQKHNAQCLIAVDEMQKLYEEGSPNLTDKADICSDILDDLGYLSNAADGRFATFLVGSTWVLPRLIKKVQGRDIIGLYPWIQHGRDLNGTKFCTLHLKSEYLTDDHVRQMIRNSGSAESTVFHQLFTRTYRFYAGNSLRKLDAAIRGIENLHGGHDWFSYHPDPALIFNQLSDFITDDEVTSDRLEDSHLQDLYEQVKKALIEKNEDLLKLLWSRGQSGIADMIQEHYGDDQYPIHPLSEADLAAIGVDSVTRNILYEMKTLSDGPQPRSVYPSSPMLLNAWYNEKG
jgi:hypothetical protein